MKVLNVRVKVEKDGAISWQTKRVSIAVTPNDITMRQWTDFWLEKMSLPSWFNDLDNLNDDERAKAFSQFDEAKWKEFSACCLNLISCMVQGSSHKKLLKNLPVLDNTDNSILILYSLILDSINTYEPKCRESFEHKGIKFVFPKATIDGVGRTWYGSEVTAGEAFEALQCSHILNSKNEFGEYVLNDRKYHTDIAMLATLARKVDEDGNIEVAPIETLEMRQFFEERVKFFSDAPMSLALDMAFFLKSSKLAYTNTLTSQSLMNRLRQALKM